jgi:threonine/homoserine/homoserine lactone efflux protein
MIDRMARNGFWAGFSVGLFVAFVDAFYCGVSLVGISLISGLPIVRILVQGLGLIFLLYLGGRHLLVPHKTSHFMKNMSEGTEVGKNHTFTLHLKNFIVVLIYALVNPNFLAFWANMANLLHTSILKTSGMHGYILFSSSVGIGSAVSQYISLRVIDKMHQFFPLSKTVIRWVSIFIFLATIVYFGSFFVKEIANLI